MSDSFNCSSLEFCFVLFCELHHELNGRSDEFSSEEQKVNARAVDPSMPCNYPLINFPLRTLQMDLLTGDWRLSLRMRANQIAGEWFSLTGVCEERTVSTDWTREAILLALHKPVSTGFLSRRGYLIWVMSQPLSHLSWQGRDEASRNARRNTCIWGLNKGFSLSTFCLRSTNLQSPILWFYKFLDCLNVKVTLSMWLLN